MELIVAESNVKGKFSILVIDDEEDFCNLIKLILAKSKFISGIVMATNAQIALQKILNQDFDLIIIDYHLPFRDGLYLIETLNKMMKLKNSQVLLVSAYFNSRDVTKAVMVGVKNLLVKPFTNQQLIDKVKKILKVS